MSPTQDEDIRTLWQTQPKKENHVMSTEALTLMESKLTRKVRWRNLRETVAAGIVVVVFLAYAGWLPGSSTGGALMRVASALTAMGAVLVITKLRRDGSPLPAPPAAAPTSDHLAHCRASLERQRDLLRGVPVWYLGPFIPGFVVFTIGAWLASPRHQPVVVTFLSGLAVAAFVLVINRRGARKLQSAIDGLR